MEKYNNLFKQLELLAGLGKVSHTIKRGYANEVEKRGLIITQSIIIEELINACISHHFVLDDDIRRDELHKIFLWSESITFMGKFKVLKFIYENHYGNFFKKHNKISGILQNFIETRNKFAHRASFSFSEKPYTEIETFMLKVRFSKEEKKKRNIKDDRTKFYDKLIIDNKQLEEYESKYQYLNSTLNELLELILKRQKILKEDKEDAIIHKAKKSD